MTTKKSTVSREALLRTGWLLACVAVAGCGRSPLSKTIVAVPLTATGEPMRTEHVGIQEAAFREQLAVDWNGPGERDAKWQVDRIQQAIHARAYGIVVTPFSTFGVNTSIREALAAGIPVAVVGAALPLSPAPHLSFVLEDMDAAAAMLQANLQHSMQGAGKLAILGADPLSNGSETRALALEEALRRHSPQIEVVARVPGPVNAGFLDIAAQQLLEQHPEVNAIVALTARAGVSAARAIRRAHLTHPVHLVSYDFTLDMMLLLRHGEADAVLVQNLRGMGACAVRNLVSDRRGKSVAAIQTFEPTLVTRENIDAESTQQLMLLHWEQP